MTQKADSSRKLSHLHCAILSAASALLLWAAFPPLDLGFLAFIAIVPLLILAARAGALRATLWAFAGGAVFFLGAIYWMWNVTIAGWLALAMYCALYWPLAVLLLGRINRCGIRFIIAAPVVLTALDFVRSVFLTGFPFYLIGHTQYRYIPVIQIADIAGVFGITFVVAVVNGALADIILMKPRTLRMAAPYTATACLLMLCVAGYGLWRMRKPTTEGPLVGMVQGNIPQDLKHSKDFDEELEVLEKHVRLTQEIPKPVDLITWPETMFPLQLNLVLDEKLIGSLLADKKEARRAFGLNLVQCRASLMRAVEAASGAPMLIGSATYDKERDEHFNSAYLISPAGRQTGRYDKIRLVVFGEFTPLSSVFPFLKVFRPEVMGPDLHPGRLRQIMNLNANGTTYKFATTICYEDAEAGLCREFKRAGAQFLVNLTNDGWFKRSSELDHHLAVCAFRAVENRLPIARNANTGITAIIDPDGRIQRRLELADGRYRGVEGTLTGRLRMDGRRTVYAAIGDIFAWVCLAAIIPLALRPWPVGKASVEKKVRK